MLRKNRGETLLALAYWCHPQGKIHCRTRCWRWPGIKNKAAASPRLWNWGKGCPISDYTSRLASWWEARCCLINTDTVNSMVQLDFTEVFRDSLETLQLHTYFQYFFKSCLSGEYQWSDDNLINSTYYQCVSLLLVLGVRNTRTGRHVWSSLMATRMMSQTPECCPGSNQTGQ